MRAPVAAENLVILKRLIAPVILLIAGATTYYLFEGICKIAPDSDLYAKGGFLLFALAVGAGIYLLWRIVLETVPKLMREDRRAALVVVAMICGAVIIVSSYLNTVGIVGDQTVERELWVMVERASEWTAAAPTHAEAARLGVTALRVNEAKYTKLADAEERGTGSTGKSLPGAVSSMYRQVAAAMGTAAADAETQVKEAKEHVAGSQSHLAEMQKCLSGKEASNEKLACFAVAHFAARADLVQLSALDIKPLIRTAIDAAREAVPPALSINPAVAALQRQAIEQLHDNLGKLDSLTKVAGAESAPPLLGAAFRPPTVFDAVARHIFEYTPIAAAVGFADLLPVLVLALVIIIERDRNSEKIEDMAAAFRVSDLLMARELEARLAASPRSVERGPDPPRTPSRTTLTTPCAAWPSCQTARARRSMGNDGFAASTDAGETAELLSD